VLRLPYVLNLRVLRSAKYRVSPKTTNADITPMNHMVSRGIELLPCFRARKHKTRIRDLTCVKANPRQPRLSFRIRQQGSE